MTFYLTPEEALRIIEAAIGGRPMVRDLGLLASALARPATTLFGADTYPSLPLKAAALLHSLVNNHALVDGNKRAGFACVAVFLGINGHPLQLTQEEAFDLVLGVADGTLTELAEIADLLCP